MKLFHTHKFSTTEVTLHNQRISQNSRWRPVRNQMPSSQTNQSVRGSQKRAQDVFNPKKCYATIAEHQNHPGQFADFENTKSGGYFIEEHKP
jgi:hypothetical protein